MPFLMVLMFYLFLAMCFCIHPMFGVIVVIAAYFIGVWTT
jgi:hypothetical protein